MSDWLEEVFGVKKPVIAMCHLLALPGDPGYDRAGGLAKVIDHARKDLHALQAGGVDAVMFSNEASLPYLTKVETITTATMARIIGELLDEVEVTLGVNVLWDPKASLDLAMATGAKFVREIFSGVYASDFGLWNTNAGEVVRHQHAIGAQDVRLLYNIVPESAVYLAPREIADIARTTIFNTRADALCVSGLTAGSETSAQVLQQVKNAVADTPVFANTGVNLQNVEVQLSIADGAVIGTAFKEGGQTFNPVSEANVHALMDKVRQFRAGL